MASAAVDDASIFRFGAYELNPRSRQLLRLGRPVAIQPRPFDLLVYLIRHRDRPVSRDELLGEVWRGVHVDDEALRFTLHAARRAVGDDGSRQEVIRTLPRVGYRLVAPIVEVPSSSDAPPQHRRKSPSLTEAPFVGREDLMRESATLLGEVARGEGRVLILSGEAGIGKSRALDEIAELAQAQGTGVLRGRCIESEGAPAFWPWVQILRAAVGSNPPDDLLRALGSGAREVAWMVPELRQFVPELPPAPGHDARAARFLMFDSVTAFLRALTAQRPFVVSIDDLHRADSASVALFQHVARELGDAGAPRLLLVGTHREAELRAVPASADALVSVTALPHARHERIQGLALVEVATLVRALSGREPSAAAASDLHRKTNGNPFFVNQILRVLQSESRLTDLDSAQSVELELPRHVQDAIRQQLQVLSGAARETVEMASVIGGDFSLTELERTMEVDRRSLLARLAPALEAGVVGERAGEHGRYRFTHALVRDVLYAGLAIDARARLHARVAHALDDLVPVHPCAESASIAHHYAQSPERADIERAVHYYEQAARWSTARGAFEDAPLLLDRALALHEGADIAAQTRRCRLMLALGDALSDAGARERAREVLLSAAALARHAGLNEELATAALRFAPDLLAIETGVYDAELVRLIEEAIASLGESRPELRAKLTARLAVALRWSRTQDSRRRELVTHAFTLASQLDDAETSGYVDTLINFSLATPERQLRPFDGRAASPSLALLRGVARVTSLLILGRVAEVDEEILGFTELVDRYRNPRARWYADLMRATRAHMEGRYEEASQLATRYLELGSKYGDRNAIHSYEAQSVMRAFDAGGIETYEPRVRWMLKAFPRMVAWRAGLVLILLELDRIDEARVEMDRILAVGPVSSLPMNEWYVTVAALALACGVVRESAVADRLYSELQPHADQLVVFGYCTYCMGSTQRLLAALAAGMEQWEAARQHFELAILKNSAIGATACNAPVYFEFARMLKSAGREDEAKRWAKHAETLSSRFGMARLREKATELL